MLEVIVMDEKQTDANEKETCPVYFEAPGIGQINLYPEQHRVITEMDQQAKLVIEENKLLKAKLKGFEALAYLYQQSKNECANLKKLCTELSDEKEWNRKKFSASDISPLDTPVCNKCFENNTFEATDPVENLHSEIKLNSDTSKTVGLQTLIPNDWNSAVLVCNERSCLSENQSFGKPEGPVELKSTEFLAMHNRMADDESQSSFSYLDVPSSLTSSDDGIENKNHEKLRDLASSSEDLANNHELFGSRELAAIHRHLMKPESTKESKGFLKELLSVGLKLISLEEQMQTEENPERGTLMSESHEMRAFQQNPGRGTLMSESHEMRAFQQNPERGTLMSESHGLRQMESSATQTFDQVEILECINDQHSNLGLTPMVDRSSSPVRRKSSIVTEDLITEVQILRQQVMTFKDDFERERQDREKVRAKYDLLKRHFDLVSSDFRDIKDQLRSTEIKLEESEREKAALRHKITKTANELRMLKKGSTTPSRTEHIQQRVSASDVQPTWPCIHCTYLNPHLRQTCEMCGQAAFRHHRLSLHVP